MLKVKILEELLKHLQSSQGKDLHSLLEESKKPKVPEGELEVEELGEPEGMSIEKLEVTKPKQNFNDKANEAIAEMDKPTEEEVIEEVPSGDSDMTDEEFDELLSKYVK